MSGLGEQISDVSEQTPRGDHPAGTGGFPPETESPGSRWWRVPMLLVIAGFAAFWVWALFFASKEAVNRIEDRGWAERAEQICATAREQRLELTNFTEIDPDDPAQRELVLTLADNLDAATDILETMLNDVVAVSPVDPKGAEIVPLWESDYRAYLNDRRVFTEDLRSGNIRGFSETAIDGLPISEKIETFAGDNEMPSCAPPYDMPSR